jgi:hypothetical protein
MAPVSPKFAAKTQSAVILAAAGLLCAAILRSGWSLHGGFGMMDLAGIVAGASRPGGQGGVLLFVVAVAAALAAPQGVRTAATASVVLVAFALSLSELWASGVSTGYSMGGFMPNSDARAWVTEAARLREGARFAFFGSREPLASGYFASMLWVGLGSLRAALALVAAAAALSLAFLLLEMRRIQGLIPAAAAAAVLFIYYRRFIGSTMSEGCGLTFGCLGAALLLRGLGKKGRLEVLAGSLCLAVGLLARAGAFFVLPCVLVAVAFAWRAERRRAAATALLCGLCMALAACGNLLMFRALGATDGRMNWNLSYTLYGTLHGGTWRTIDADYPDLMKVPEPERSTRVYAIVFSQARADPSLVVKGALRAWREFIGLRDGAFGFVTMPPSVEVCCLVLGAWGILSALVAPRTRPESALLLAGAAGILLSLPFAPPWDADGMRAYAATMPFPALAVSTGVLALTDGLVRLRSKPSESARVAGQQFPATPGSASMVVFAAALVTAAALLPFVIRFAGHPAQASTIQRGPEGDILMIDVRPGGSLVVTAGGPTRPGEVSRDALLANLGPFSHLWKEQEAYIRKVAPLLPTFISPDSSGMAFIILRHRLVDRRERITVRGRVLEVHAGKAMFIEDGLPPPDPGG